MSSAIYDNMHEECGVFGVFNNPDAARLTYLGLYALQHRGQESSGIAVSNTTALSMHKGMGLVNQVFGSDDALGKLAGPHAVGHNRYSTTGSSTLVNAQPILINFKAGQIAGAHNGNLTNALSLKRQMEKDGSIFMSTTDTEVIMHLVARSRRPTIEAMILESSLPCPGRLLNAVPHAGRALRRAGPARRAAAGARQTGRFAPALDRAAPSTSWAQRSFARSNPAK